MRIAFLVLLAIVYSCTAHKRNTAKQQQEINAQIEVLYKQYSRLSDSEMHITRPLAIPADTIHFMDSLNAITDTAIGVKEIEIWEKIKALQGEYWRVGGKK